MRSSLRSQQKSRAGFSQIELLVVIAIFGILIGILLPAIQYVREAARKTQCRNNLHNFSVALENYRSLHDGLYPVLNWPEALLPFMEVRSVNPETCPEAFICPADRTTQVGQGSLGSYGFNSRLMLGLKDTDLKDGAGSTIVMAETRALKLGAATSLGSEISGLNLEDSPHAGGANVLFADGQVVFLQANKYSVEIILAFFTPNGGEVVTRD